MTYSVPLGLQLAHGLDGGIGLVLCQLSQLVDDASLGLEVLAFLGTLVGSGGVLGLEEVVAGAGESLPELFAVLARHGSDGLPLLLQLYELVGCLAPFGAVLQRFGFFHEATFLLEVLCLLVLHGPEEFCLRGEELVARGAEAVEDDGVLAVVGVAYRAPLSL